MLCPPSAELGEQIEGLVACWPHPPYAGVVGLAPGASASYLLHSLRNGQRRGDATYIVRDRAGAAAALLQWGVLQWDSAILGFPVARINAWLHQDVDDSLLSEVLERAAADARASGVRYLLARIPASDAGCLDALQKSGFHLLDGLLTYGIRPEPRLAVSAPGFLCQAFGPGDAACLQEIAAASFTLDRFHADPVIPGERAEAIYRSWVEDSCAGFADCVLVARRGDQVAGFTTLKMDKDAESILGIRVGQVVLVAVAEPCRRMRVGSLLTRQSLEWFRERGCTWVEVGTQVANIPASRLYQSAGFRLIASSLTFRLLL